MKLYPIDYIWRVSGMATKICWHFRVVHCLLPQNGFVTLKTFFTV